jgi:phage I-like protein
MAPALHSATLDALPFAPVPAGGEVPLWVQLVPTDAGGTVATVDGRGPYRVEDAAAVIHASFRARPKLAIDENHATDLAAPQGGPSPARGWIVELQARDDGLWGRVDWNASGRALVADRAYLGLSPAILHDEAGRIRSILGASLVNRPNLRGIAALHSDQGQDMKDWEKVAEALGLAATATPDEALAKVTELKGATALHGTLGEIGTALGVEGADPAAIVAAAKLARAGTADVTALQSELATLRTQVSALEGARARAASEAYIDAEMAKGRVGLNATTRDDLVALHMTQSDAAKRLIEAMPLVGPGAGTPPRQKAPGPDGTVALNAEQQAAIAALAVDPAKYRDTLKLQAEAA